MKDMSNKSLQVLNLVKLDSEMRNSRSSAKDSTYSVDTLRELELDKLRVQGYVEEADLIQNIQTKKITITGKNRKAYLKALAIFNKINR